MFVPSPLDNAEARAYAGRVADITPTTGDFMPIQPGVISLSKSQKKNGKKNLNHVPVVLHKSTCSSCGQVANAVRNASHLACKGFPADFFQKTITPKVPAGLADRLRGKVGRWVDPVVPIAAPETPLDSATVPS